VVCETGTLPIRSTRKIIQYSPKHNASVGYPTVALPLVRASIATHETDPRLSDSATSKKVPKWGRTNKNLLRVCDARQTIKMAM
jgi:hypothetical protein